MFNDSMRKIKNPFQEGNKIQGIVNNNENVQSVLNQEDAQQKFKQLLYEKNITKNDKFDHTLNLIKDDYRANQLTKLSLKKKIYYEYLNELQEAERDQRRHKIKQSHNNFIKMLEEKGIQSNAKLDPRFREVEEQEREKLFQDYLEDCFNREREELRSKRRQQRDQFRKILEQDDISSNFKWNQCREKYSYSMLYQSMAEYDRFMAFQDYILDREQIEKQQQKIQQKRNERQNRDNFKKFLQQQKELDVLTYKTKWYQFINMIKSANEFIAIVGQPGSTPRELFEDYIEILSKEHKIMKDDLKILLKTIQYQFSQESNFKDFQKKLQKFPQYSSMQISKQKKYFEYSMEKYRSKEKELHKKYQKAEKKFLALLQKLNITQNSKYEEYIEIINKKQEKFEILTTNQRIQLFQNYIKDNQHQSNYNNSRNIANQNIMGMTKNKNINQEKSSTIEKINSEEEEEGEVKVGHKIRQKYRSPSSKSRSRSKSRKSQYKKKQHHSSRIK